MSIMRVGGILFGPILDMRIAYMIVNIGIRLWNIIIIHLRDDIG